MTIYRYSLHIDGSPVANFNEFGDANRAAMGVFPNFDVYNAAFSVMFPDGIARVGTPEGVFPAVRLSAEARVYGPGGRVLCSYYHHVGAKPCMIGDEGCRTDPSVTIVRICSITRRDTWYRFSQIMELLGQSSHENETAVAKRLELLARRGLFQTANDGRWIRHQDPQLVACVIAG